MILFITGLYLRMYELGTFSLWDDEIATITYASNFSDNFIYHWNKFKNNSEPFSPFYYIFNSYFIHLDTVNEFKLRLPSAIIGSLSIPLMYFFARQFADKFRSMAVACLVTFSATLISFSQEGRVYIYMFFFAILLLHLILKLKENKNETTYLYFLLALISTLFIHLHYFSIIFVIGLSAYLLFIFRSKKDIKISLVIFLSLVTYLPWLPKMIKHFSFSGRNTWLGSMELWQATQSLLHFYFIDRFLHIQQYNLILTISVLTLLIYLVYKYYKKSKFNLLLFCSTYLFVLCFIKSLIGQNAFHVRYLIISMPFVYCLLLSDFGIKSKKLNYIHSVVFVILLSGNLILGHAWYEKSGIKELTREVSKNFQKGEKQLVIYCAFNDLPKIYKEKFQNTSEFRSLCDFNSLSIVLSREQVSSFHKVYLIDLGRTNQKSFIEGLTSNIYKSNHRNVFGTPIITWSK
jgi:4-amino-4-deoxy-L-arabinose transferase-like glycosyltransferase